MVRVEALTGIVEEGLSVSLASEGGAGLSDLQQRFRCSRLQLVQVGGHALRDQSLDEFGPLKISLTVPVVVVYRLKNRPVFLLHLDHFGVGLPDLASFRICHIPSTTVY